MPLRWKAHSRSAPKSRSLPPALTCTDSVRSPRPTLQDAGSLSKRVPQFPGAPRRLAAMTWPLISSMVAPLQASFSYHPVPGRPVFGSIPCFRLWMIAGQACGDTSQAAPPVALES